MKKRIARLGLALLLAAPLGACALANAGSGPAPRLFTLTAPQSAVADGRTAVQLQISEFAAPAAIDTTRIVFQENANEIKYYAEARWSDTAPNMIQTLLSQTLENSGRFASVFSHGADLNSDYMLMGDIRQFAAVAGTDDKGGGTSVHVDLFMRLVRISDRTVTAARDFSVVVPVTGSGIASVVAAYDAGLHKVLGDISLWTIQQTTKSASPSS
jgi:cholesterol transport system auxiliary component